jgi:broad specificity phosphatase PhoE
MTGQVIFLTHADVAIDPSVPVPDWGLNDTGHARHRAFAEDPCLSAVRAVYASTERKAREGAAPVAKRFGLVLKTREDLGENDRSATGYLPPDAFWPVVDAFFAAPDTSVRGWETARHAQTRIATAIGQITVEAPEGDILVVAHGGVGNLLRCTLLGKEISREEGQPHPKGGCWFRFPRDMNATPTDWISI